MLIYDQYGRIIVSPEMLFRGLFITSNLKIYLEALSGILNGEVRLTFCIGLGVWTWESHHPPFSVASPLPLSGTWTWVWCWTYRLYACPCSQVGQSIPESMDLYLWFLQWQFCTATRGWFSLVWIGTGFSAHGKWVSSPLFIICHHHHQGISPLCQPRSESISTP